jgi:hypothetical protein
MNIVTHIIERVRDLIEERHGAKLLGTWRDERLFRRHVQA